MKQRYSIIFLIIFFITNNNIFAQEQKSIDSLKNIIENTNIDSIKIDSYIKISQSYSIENIEYKYFLHKALILSKKIDFKNDYAECCFNLGKYYNFDDNYDSAFLYFNEGLRIFTELKNNMYRAAILGEMGNSYCFRSEYDECLDCYLQALEIMYELDNKEWIGIVLNNIGNVYSYLSDDTTSLKYYQDALLVFNEIESLYGIALSTNNIGSIYFDRNDLDTALVCFIEALEICEEIDYYEQMIESSTNIANTGYPRKVGQLHGTLKVPCNFATTSIPTLRG